MAVWYFDRFTEYPKTYPSRMDYPCDVWAAIEHLDGAYDKMAEVTQREKRG